MQAARQLARQLDGLLHQGHHAVGGGGFRLVRQFFREHLARQRRGRQMLSQTVVQIIPDAPLLAFAGLDQFFFQADAFPDFLPQFFRPLPHQHLQFIPGQKPG